MGPRKGTAPHNKGKGTAAQQAAAEAPATEARPEVTFSALQQLEEKRKRLCSQLKDVERQIFDLETRYLEGCNPNANALKGYEGLRSQVGSSKSSKSQPVDPQDRIFSTSSTAAAR